MDILIWILLIVISFFLISHFLGKPDFWKLTRKHPFEAWQFFNNHPAWFVGDKPLDVDVVGPFRVVNPVDGNLVRIYCQSSQLESSQSEFMKKFDKS